MMKIRRLGFSTVFVGLIFLCACNLASQDKAWKTSTQSESHMNTSMRILDISCSWMMTGKRKGKGCFFKTNDNIKLWGVT